ncbi:MAG: patatin-like phospholipase family protein [Flavobacteriales bacterium]
MSYSILSLDGGGTWALVQVMILQDRFGEHAQGHDILRNFDMAIANSGGSIVLAGLCLDMRLSEIRRLFEDVNVLQEIFTRVIPGSSLTGRFSAKEKKVALKKYLIASNTTALEAESFVSMIPSAIGKPIRIIITGFDYSRSRAVYFRSDRNSPMESGEIMNKVSGGTYTASHYEEISLLDAVHVSSNAPVEFFDKPAKYNTVSNGKVFSKLGWDGAIGGNNNPVFSGVLEALAYGIAADDIRVVSIGTANTVLPVSYGMSHEPSTTFPWLVTEAGVEGNRSDIRKLATAIISDPPDAATFNTFHLLRRPYVQNDSAFIRINPLVKPILDINANTWKMPGNGWRAADMKRFFEMDMAVRSSVKVGWIARFTKDFIEGYAENQGVRLGGKGLSPILGHRTYAEAIADWRSWSDQLADR